MLFPAGVLVLLILAAITVDSSIAFLGERALADATASAANDAAIEGLSNRSFYEGGQVELNPADSKRIAEARVRDLIDPGRYHGLRVTVEVSPPYCRVIVTAEADVDYIFAKAVPGASDEIHVQSTSSATPRQDANSAPCPP
jgi:Flp pilus assembly protein TadG